MKDKVPAGVYVLLVSLFDRIGGKPLKWSKADAGLYEKLKPSTQPLVHKGRFYDIDMRFNQSIFVVSPSETKIEPSMCFVFELYRLADKKIPVDRCVGWTVRIVWERERSGRRAGVRQVLTTRPTLLFMLMRVAALPDQRG